MTSHPNPNIDPWRDEMLASLFGRPARYKANELPDTEPESAYVRRARVSLGTCAPVVRP